MSSKANRQMAVALHLNHRAVNLYLYGSELVVLLYVGLMVNRKGRLRIIGSKRRRGKKSGTNT